MAPRAVAGAARHRPEPVDQVGNDVPDDRNPHHHEHRADIVGRGFWSRETSQDSACHGHDEKADDNDDAA